MTLIDELKKERLKQLDEAHRTRNIIEHLEELLKLLGEHDPVLPPAIEDAARSFPVLKDWELDSFLGKYNFARKTGQTDEEYRAAFSNYINSRTSPVLRPFKHCPECYTFDTHQPGCPVGQAVEAAQKIEKIVRKDIMTPYDRNDTRDTPISSVINDEI